MRTHIQEKTTVSIGKLTVIGTSHTEGVACTANELIKIIEELSPQTIFCEAPPEVFQAMLKAIENFNTPEIKVLRTIIEKTSIDIVPVDINDDPFDGRLEAMFELFRRQISDYFYATEIQANETQLKGFAFLNSKDSDQIHKDKSSMERIFIERVKNHELSKTYSNWLKWNDERENHWIDVIHNYFVNNRPKKAVFLVGSAHRVRLMDKIQNFSGKNELIPDWNFYPFK